MFNILASLTDPKILLIIVLVAALVFFVYFSWKKTSASISTLDGELANIQNQLRHGVITDEKRHPLKVENVSEYDEDDYDDEYEEDEEDEADEADEEEEPAPLHQSQVSQVSQVLKQAVNRTVAPQSVSRPLPSATVVTKHLMDELRQLKEATDSKLIDIQNKDVSDDDDYTDVDEEAEEEDEVIEFQDINESAEQPVFITYDIIKKQNEKAPVEPPKVKITPITTKPKVKISPEPKIKPSKIIPKIKNLEVKV